MTENDNIINQLLEKLEFLLTKQEVFSKEINELREEINKFKKTHVIDFVEEKKEIHNEAPVVINDLEVTKEIVSPIVIATLEKPFTTQAKQETAKPLKPKKIILDFEKFIGENLINKIGIAITVIGVAIGAKYSIEHQLISPLTRIILGYLMGLGLLGFGAKLKKNYENYSAVLVSGAMAIMFFITFTAYSLYSLFPQEAAFALMVVFTAFTVVAAIYYNRQIIAHIGLVGAYAVPFLLSDGSGKVEILFSYMAIINIGILIIAFKKYWKPLYYASFILTWLIFILWFVAKYQTNLHFVLSVSFLSTFFVTFYTTFLAYKLLRKEKFEIWDILLLLANSFVFFGMGYSILSKHVSGGQLLGLFTLGNAIVHFVVSAVIYRQKLADKNLFFLIAGLVLVFITIAIPVQLDGNWVTLLWVGEAALLFWIGRTKNVSVYEMLSYPLMILAFFSIVHDWLTNYHIFFFNQSLTRVTPLLNIYFFTSVLFIAIFTFIFYLNNHKKYVSSLFSQIPSISFIRFVIPAILITVIYYAFRMEISSFWTQLYADSVITLKTTNSVYPDTIRDSDLQKFKTIWLINYSFLFFSLLTIVNIRKFKNKYLGFINMGLNAIEILIFLTIGLYFLSELRDNYLNQVLSEYYHRTAFYIGIRYVSFAFAGMSLVSIYKYTCQDFLKSASSWLKITFDFLLFTSVLWVLSSELINLMDMMKFTQSYKLGLSILWGVYALLLIALGIWKNKKYLRISAIALFGITLIKLFTYDISYLDTIAKTIVFVSLGILLLIISFLYNKYKKIIF